MKMEEKPDDIIFSLIEFTIEQRKINKEILSRIEKLEKVNKKRCLERN